mmetsp:Transcript_52633/g.87182  ORF Transcript_52633/g.87182 Transcript_52633/m.87182 type:complete len:221 (-) Transcript_52633:179-841(-)
MAQPKLQPNMFKGKVSLGTSIIATTFADGVVMAADTRTSAGVYIVDRFTDKVKRLTDNIYVCESGSAADTEAIADYVAYYLDHQSMEIDEAPRVKTAAKLINGFIYPNKNNLMASMIVAGYDKYDKGSIYALSLGGTAVRQNWTISGSGSTFIYGYCDSQWKANMSRAEAEQFCVNALTRATFRDGYSGGFVRVVVITKDGVERRSQKVDIEYENLKGDL